MLPTYGNDWVSTPSISRLAEMGLVYRNHFCGSMPCIPARRDFLTGRACFLEAPWGPLEPWDDVMPNILRNEKDTYSHMITDHPHYFNGGAGDRYHNCFDSWEYERGQVWDPWHGIIDVDNPAPGSRIYGYSVYEHQHYANLMFRDSEIDEDYPSVRCVQRAIDFLENNQRADNWHLHLEIFDPHEPFDCPTKYLAQYGDSWTGPPYTSPGYRSVDPDSDSEDSIQHLRNAYAGSLSMVDTWLGRLFDTMDRYDMWRDTAVILTTDHGLLIGEHNRLGKNFPFVYSELCRLPLIVYHPEFKSGVYENLTGAVDLMPTFLELHGVESPDHLHGKSLLQHAEGDQPVHEEGLLYGYFGSSMNYTDGNITYTRNPLPGSVTHTHFSSIIYRDQSAFPGTNVEDAKGAEHGTFLDNCRGVPHYRAARKWNGKSDYDFNPVFHLENDPDQQRPIRDENVERDYARKLSEALSSYGAPACHKKRLGL